MLNINIIDDTFLLRNINKDSIRNIYSIYGNTCDFKYATGIFNSIDYDDFSNQISQFISRKKVFFLDICLISSGELIGFIKGSLTERDKIGWINSLVIDTTFQSNGYGKKVVNLLENYLKINYSVEKIYLSVHKSNGFGIKFWNKCGYGNCDYIFQGDLYKFNEFAQIMWKIL